MSYLAFALLAVLMGGGMWLSRGLGVPQVWLYGVGMAVLVGMAAESCLGRVTHGKRRAGYQAFSAWTTAALLVGAALWLVQVTPADWQPQIEVAMSAAAALYLFALREASDPESRFAQYGRFASTLMIFFVVFLLFTLIYQTRQRALFTATSVGVVSLLACLELLRSGVDRKIDRQVMALSGIATLALSEAAWALGYWPMGGLVGGAMLLLGFYVLVGLLQCIRDGSLGRAAVIEYGAVGVVGLLAVLIAVP
ncbi:MAG TPA: hypothetical protein VF960_08735 [Chloroflexota bacterium]